MAEKKGFGEKFKKFSKNPTVKKTALIVGLIILFFAIGIFVFNLIYADKILPKTYAGGINLGSKSKEEALALLKNQSEQSANNTVELKFLDRQWSIKAQDLDLKYDPQKTADIAWQTGREGSFGKISREQLKSIFSSNRRLAYFTYDKNKLNTALLEIANKIDTPEKDATVVIQEDLVPRVEEEKTGLKLNFYQNYEEIIKAFGNFQESSFELAVDKINPKINQQSANEAKNLVQKLLNGKIVLSSENKSYTLTPENFASWFVFVAIPSQKTETKKLSEEEVKQMGGKNEIENSWVLAVEIDPGKIGQYVADIASEIYQEPKDAKFEVNDGRVSAFQISQTGYELDKEKTVAAVSTAILKQEEKVDLPIKVTNPEITSSDPAKAGIKELIGEGDTSWRGSPQNRIHNLQLGASKISGTVVKPGEEFSTLKTIGEIGPSTGFLPELVIKNSTQVVPDYGGGLCQVSTTLFRAILHSGLKVTDRTPHSFRVSYYEPPVGMDATIYDPAPDLKFINDMKTPILIWAVAGNNSLSFQFYGTKDGRRIDISDPVTYDYVSPPGAVYTESDSMAPGEIRQVERALSGCSASFTYKVIAADGSVLEDEKFESKYVALPNSYLVGPGYQAPPPETPVPE